MGLGGFHCGGGAAGAKGGARMIHGATNRLELETLKYLSCQKVRRCTNTHHNDGARRSDIGARGKRLRGPTLEPFEQENRAALGGNLRRNKSLCRSTLIERGNWRTDGPLGEENPPHDPARGKGWSCRCTRKPKPQEGRSAEFLTEPLKTLKVVRNKESLRNAQPRAAPGVTCSPGHRAGTERGRKPELE